MGAQMEAQPGETHSGAGPAKAHVAGTEVCMGAGRLLEDSFPLPFLSQRKQVRGERPFPECILSEPRPGDPPGLIAVGLPGPEGHPCPSSGPFLLLLGPMSQPQAHFVCV